MEDEDALLYLLSVQQQILLGIQVLLQFTLIQQLLSPRIKKYRRKLPKGRNQRRRIHFRHQPPRNRQTLYEGDIYEDTGLFEDQYLDLCGRLYGTIQKKRNAGPNFRTTSTSLDFYGRIRLALIFLRTNSKYRQLAARFKVSVPQVSREIKHILPKLVVELNFITWPSQFPSHSFERVAAIIDCSSHFRWRQHPRQADLYRADKGAFFITAQVVCSLEGDFWNVALGLGHNNDKGMLNLTGMKEFLVLKNIRMLADRGYSFIRLVTPDDVHDTPWNNKQKALRSTVETAIGMVKLYEMAAQKCRLSLEMHEIGLMVCYQLTNINLSLYPLRPFQ